MTQKKDKWNNQFNGGKWSALSKEIERYSCLAGYINSNIHSNSGGKPVSILDLGCGEGHLLKLIFPHHVQDYTCVDVSDAALSRIDAQNCKVIKICSPLEELTLTTPYGVMIFNEVLYYLKKPEQIFVKLLEQLCPDGRVIVSIHQKRSWWSPNSQVTRMVRRVLNEKTSNHQKNEKTEEKEKFVNVSEILLKDNQSGTSWLIFSAKKI